MRKDKGLAIEMRKTGKSYNEILAALKIPKATLSDWFGHEDWSNDIRKNLTYAANKIHAVRLRELDRVRGLHLKRAYDEAREEARVEFGVLKFNPLFISGLMLYWGEGDKATKSAVQLTNTDPEMMLVFRLFLTDVCKVPLERLGAHVLIYPDLDSDTCIKYWSEHSGLPIKRFRKSVTIQGRHKTRRLTHGVCEIHVCSTYFKVKVMTWLNLLSKKLMNHGEYASI